jgi:hypothetical protein
MAVEIPNYIISHRVSTEIRRRGSGSPPSPGICGVLKMNEVKLK